MKKKIILISLALINPSCFFQQNNINGSVKSENEINVNESIKPKDSNTNTNNIEQKIEEKKDNNDIKTSSSPNITISTTPSNIILERSQNYGGGGGSGGGGAISKPISTNIVGQIKEDESIMSTPIPSTANDVPYSSTSGSEISGKVKN